MRITAVLRDARRRRGMSLRAAAEHCGVPRGTWAGWESGSTSPTATRLDEVLAVLHLDLRLVDRDEEPPGEDQVRRHLRLSLTDRTCRALADQLPVVLAAAREAPRLLTGPAVTGVWVPHVVARGPLPLPEARDAVGLVPVHVGAGPGSVVLVPPPALLVSAGLDARWPALRTSARLLAVEGPRDAAGRQLPPQRDPDEEREVADLAQTLTWGARPPFPVSPQDSRGWRLGGAASLDELLERKGFPPRHPR